MHTSETRFGGQGYRHVSSLLSVVRLAGEFLTVDGCGSSDSGRK